MSNSVLSVGDRVRIEWGSYTGAIGQVVKIDENSPSGYLVAIGIDASTLWFSAQDLRKL
jgi:hypothetical protein